MVWIENSLDSDVVQAAPQLPSWPGTYPWIGTPGQVPIRNGAQGPHSPHPTALATQSQLNENWQQGAFFGPISRAILPWCPADGSLEGHQCQSANSP